jgi:aryl-alcohol dehydrogenase-like predicted oxidoreductase
VHNAVLGRTNRTFPPVWLSLYEPDSAEKAWAGPLVAAALAANTVIDITSNPALWGGLMRGTEATLMIVGTKDIRVATDEKHAYDLVQAHLIQILSAVGREHVDLYFVPVGSRLESFQINGALSALSEALEDGHVRHLGLTPEDSEAASLWRSHDAFEILLMRKDDPALVALAAQRRVGVVSTSEGHAVLLKSVSSPEQIAAAFKSMVAAP